VLRSKGLDALAAAERVVRQALAMRAELDEPAPPFNIALDDDPARAMFQLAAIAPLGPADLQRVLVIEEASEMLAMLAAMVTDQVAVLAQRLAGS
jgi:hypothetical protein